MLLPIGSSDGKLIGRSHLKMNTDAKLRLVVHTVLTKTILYLSVLIFSLASFLCIISAVILCVIAHILWFVTRRNILDGTLSKEACDKLEMELMVTEMKTGKEIQSDWVTVDIKTESALDCSMRLHSLIYIEGSRTSDFNFDDCHDNYENTVYDTDEKNKSDEDDDNDE